MSILLRILNITPKNYSPKMNPLLEGMDLQLVELHDNCVLSFIQLHKCHIQKIVILNDSRKLCVLFS